MIIKRFKEQVEAFADRIAVKKGNQLLTYGELNHYSDKVAIEIMKGDQTKEQDEKNCNVSLLFEHGTHMIVGIIGALKANKTFVPLDVNYPQKRLVYMLGHSESYILLTNSENHALAETLVKQSAGNIRILLIDNIKNIDDDLPDNYLELEREASAKQPAYILYTSGSTGKPKGVVQNHENVLHFITHWTQRFSVTESDRITLLASLSHDGAIPDIFASLLNGAVLYPYDIKKKPNVSDLIDWLRQEKITIWHSVPTLYRYFTDALSGKELFPHLRLLVLGGEEVRTYDITRFKTYFPGSKFANIYGQTESTVNSIWLFSQQDSFKRVIIGEPIGDTEILLVDEEGDTVEEMGMGEIVIASQHVALGYWKDKENSDKVFTTHSELGRLYWTGDLGKLNADGSITITGRKDFQVKIRGFRVETGEIETMLLKHPAIKEVVVTAKKDENSDNYLCAYMVSNGFTQPAELRKFLTAELPDYMIPKYFINIEKMPLTTSGKIDRNALPEPGREPQSESEYQPPINHIEKKLIPLWQEVLGIREIGINSNFFDLGGHSLIIMTVLSKIHQAFNVELQIKDVFDNPTIKELSQLILDSGQTLFSSIKPLEKKEYYVLSSAQRRLLVLQQMEEKGIAYNIPSVWQLEGDLDVAKFESVFQQLVQRHEIFRTSFHMMNAEPVQRINEKVEIKVEVEEEQASRLEGTRKLASLSFFRPFDLARAPLFRLGIIEQEEQKNILMTDMHHIIADGISIGIFIREFTELYARKEPPALRLQYKDYSEWQKRQALEKSIQQQETYWLKEFAGELPVLDLPTDYPRPLIQDFAGSSLPFEINGEKTNALKSLANEQGVTLFMLLVSLYTVCLSRLSGQEDIVVGTPIAGRRHVDLEPLMGMFANTLALRNFPLGSMSFTRFLAEIKESTTKAFENQDYLYEDLVDKVAANRDIGRNPLFDTMFALQHFEALKIEVPGLKVQSLDYETRISKFDLTLTAVETGENLLFIFEYCTKLFKQETIRRFIRYFTKTISTVIDSHDIRISEIEIIDEEEKNRILYEFNDTAANYPKEKTIHRLFEEQVEKTPDHTVLVGKEEGWKGRRIEGKEEEGTRELAPLYITYRELNHKVSHLAHLLIKKGIKPDTIVGIMVERSIDMVIIIFGILKAGSAYLPIDPEYPEERIDFMLKDSGAQVLVVDDTTYASCLSFAPKALLNLFEGHHLNFPASQLPSFPASLPSSLAYVIYTSGTTGKPKGVMIENRSLVNFIKGITDIVPFEEKDRIFSLTTISFDIFSLETILPLTKGSRVIIGTEDQQVNAGLAAKVMEKEGITIFQATPSRLQLFILDSKAGLTLRRLKYLLVGGEALPGVLLKELTKLTGGKIYNVYGPTETTVWSTLKDVTRGNAINIGKPIANTYVYILGPRGSLHPVGVAGELCISGAGVARGYANDPGLTREKFTANTFIGGERMYHTGDLARWLPEGEIEFLGRTDFQVKIRGFRIELGEIEFCLLKVGEVKEAVVLTQEKDGGNKYICAYFVSNSEYKISELREYLSMELPDYMIPSFFVRLEKIPLTPNGKVDRKALEVLGKRLAQGTVYVPPRNEAESKMVDIWKEVLQLEKVGIHDNYFDLGGTSFEIIRINSKLKEIFQMDIPVVTMFRYPTVRSLTQYLSNIKTEIRDRSTSLKRGKGEKMQQLQKRRGTRNGKRRY